MIESIYICPTLTKGQLGTSPKRPMYENPKSPTNETLNQSLDNREHIGQHCKSLSWAKPPKLSTCENPKSPTNETLNQSLKSREHICKTIKWIQFLEGILNFEKKASLLLAC